MSKTTNIKKMLESADNEAVAHIEAHSAELAEFIESFDKRFKNGITANIYIEFGEYLYNAMGKKVNPSPKNQILTDYWTDQGKQIRIDMAADGETNLIKFFAKRNERNNWYNSSARKDYTITHAVVSKTFGMGYVTPGKQVRGINIPSTHIFFYLTQDHVDLITNKQKRACAQEFLNFRDNYMKILADLNDDKAQIVDREFIGTMAVLREVKVKNKLSQGMFNNDGSTATYMILEEEVPASINAIEVNIDDTSLAKDLIKGDSKLWNISSRRLKKAFQRSHRSGDHAICINLYNHNRNNNDVTYYGSVKLSETTQLPLDVESIRNSGRLCSYGPSTSSYDFKYEQPLGRLFKPTKVESATGFIMDWKKILSDDSVVKALDQRVKFFETASKTLYHLKKKHAALVMIHGIF